MIGTYPDLTELELTDRPVLEPLLRGLRDGLSELTFAGLYCFRFAHNYRIGRMADGTIVLAGMDKGQCFFVCPFALPAPKLLDELFQRCTCMKLVTLAQAEPLRQAGYAVTEDRDNFDYLYHREQLTTLAGRALQRKRNLVHAFERAHDDYRSVPLSPELVPDALAVLEGWREHARDQADYAPSRDALLHMTEFGLQGRISYVGGQAAAYALGEPIGAPGVFVVHYEKTFPDIKGLYQVINRDFVRAMPPEITVVNREQDLGDPGLRQAKMTYRPFDFVKKYRVRKPSP